jgi:hypothetical protein
MTLHACWRRFVRKVTNELDWVTENGCVDATKFHNVKHG